MKGRACRAIQHAIHWGSFPSADAMADGAVLLRHDAHAGRCGIWCKALPGAQEALIGGDPTRFFRPPYVGVHGWIGISLEAGQDWDLVADVIEEAYRMTAPKRLIAALDEGRTG